MHVLMTCVNKEYDIYISFRACCTALSGTAHHLHRLLHDFLIYKGVIRRPILYFLTHLPSRGVKPLHGLTLGQDGHDEAASQVLIAGGHQLIKDRAQEARGGRGRGV